MKCDIDEQYKTHKCLCFMNWYVDICHANVHQCKCHRVPEKCKS